MDSVLAQGNVGPWCLVAVIGEFDLASAPAIRTQLISVINANPGRDLAIDLRGVGFIDSVGLGVLVGARRRVTTTGGRFALIVDDLRLLRSISLAGLSEVFVTFTSPSDLS
jgi:anti-sigma B factor antagonist